MVDLLDAAHPVAVEAIWPRKRWIVAPRVPSAQLRALAPDLPPLLAQLCVNRGLSTRDAIDEFFRTPDVSDGDPFRLPEMTRAVDRIERAIRDRELVAVYGDYDVDGVASAALLTQFLEALGARVRPFIPSRQQDGYGLRAEPLARHREQGVSLVVTVDCGVSGAAEVDYARGIGIDVVVTDHHTAPETLPRAVAVVDPARRDLGHPEDRCLAGVGIAFRVAQALATRFPGADACLSELLDLVALATIADVCDLTGQNRALVRLGLQRMRAQPRPGLRALMLRAAVFPDRLDEESVAYRLAPRLNAAGRMASAMDAYALLRARTLDEALPLADTLHELNQRRQQEQDGSLREAHALIAALAEVPPFVTVRHDGWSSGTVGLVAGKLAEAYCRPVLVLSRDGASWRGSARSIPGFDVTAALSACADLLEAFGGHAGAAGCVVPDRHVEELRIRLEEYAATRLAPEDLTPALAVDARVRFATIVDPAVLRGLRALAPFGPGNEQPTFETDGVGLTWPRQVGRTSSHLKFGARSDARTIGAIAFGMGALFPQLGPGARADLVYSPRWRDAGYDGGEATLELCVEDIRVQTPSPQSDTSGE